MMKTLAQALDASEPRPPTSGSRSDKKNYAQRLSQNLATVLANALRKDFPSILPDEAGRQQESRARTSKGVKKLDINYSTPELGLGLGISIKTINYRDAGTKRYTKNYTRVDNELRAEAKDYHQRQPYAVLVAVIFLPIDSCEDGLGDSPSSFGGCMKIFRHRANRQGPRDEEELFERVFIGLYSHEPSARGDVEFMDVMDSPPKKGRPRSPVNRVFGFAELVSHIIETYDLRNNPPFEWSE